ncbi:MAG TPA: ATP-binding domain-containing protein [Burkholderiaceae bacterium]|nr:ATP-binding domain-containing protein [Burkholderiaceae bacterium]
MAKIFPSDWRTLERTGAAAREIETLALLEAGLPDRLTVFHGVHWTRVGHERAAFGEIDFVIVSADARILLVEQKSGFLSETADGLLKVYAGGGKSVAVQLGRTLENLQKRLAPVLQGEPTTIDYLLYCPDYTVRNPGTAGVPPERIVDATRHDRLCTTIVEALPPATARESLARRLRAFFADELRLVPDASAMLGQAEQLVTRLSGGLATWARRLDFDPFRLRVMGTAGSGKTQLALAVLADAARAGRRALYVCFNRPLADHLARVAPAEVEIATFHQLCDRRLRAAGERLEFAGPAAFEELERRFAQLPVREEERVDDLIVDEGQDFAAAWVAPLLARLKYEGRAWWLEDPMQNLYGRPAVDLHGWVTLHADTNYRSPRDVLAYLNRLLDPRRRIEAASPIAGANVELLTYTGDPGLLEATKRAVSLALQAGFRKSDIALVTFSGRDRSYLMHFDRIGPHVLRSFTGRYDLLGAPEFSDGDLLIETVYRFKGQAAPCVILTEVDFGELDDLMQRKLFVGMTRASMKLIVVLSERAAGVLSRRVEG